MGTTDKYCLRWNDYRSNISLAFQDLRSSADFFDVTLATEEAEIRAHRVILSACSPHLRDVLKRHANSNSPNLLIYLRGVRQCDLEAILEFMYNGEVNVSQEDLNSFLAVAEDLKVKGLTQNTAAAGNSNLNHSGVPASADLNRSIPSAVLAAGGNRSKAAVTPSQNLSNKNGGSAAPPVAKRFKRDPSLPNVKEEAGSNQQVVVTPDVSFEGGDGVGDGDDDDNIEEDGAGYEEEGEVYPYGTYESEGGDAMVDPNTMAVAGTSAVDGSKDFLDSPLVRSWVGRGPDGRRMCKLCGLTGGDVTRIKNHIESVHWPHSQGYACEQCNAICKTRHALACHKSRHHSKNKNNAAVAAAAAANNLLPKNGGNNIVPDLPVHPDVSVKTENLVETVVTPVLPDAPEPISPEPVTPVSRRGRKRSSKRS